jgi:hypothetical protein
VSMYGRRTAGAEHPFRTVFRERESGPAKRGFSELFF